MSNAAAAKDANQDVGEAELGKASGERVSARKGRQQQVLRFSRLHTCNLWNGARLATSGRAYKRRAMSASIAQTFDAPAVAPVSGLSAQLLAEAVQGAGAACHFGFVEVLSLA